jgi:hypothetical protein
MLTNEDPVGGGGYIQGNASKTYCAQSTCAWLIYLRISHNLRSKLVKSTKGARHLGVSIVIESKIFPQSTSLACDQ